MIGELPWCSGALTPGPQLDPNPGFPGSRYLEPSPPPPPPHLCRPLVCHLPRKGKNLPQMQMETEFNILTHWVKSMGLASGDCFLPTPSLLSDLGQVSGTLTPFLWLKLGWGDKY